MDLGKFLRRVPGLRASVRRVRRWRSAIVTRLSAGVGFEKLPPALAVPLTYEVMLGRRPDQDAVADFVASIKRGELTRQDMAHMLRGSEEFHTTPRYSESLLGFSIHSGRCQFIQMLPKARRILDLGGVHQYRDIGALVALGYPYPFEELVIVDLPWDERHEIYQRSRQLTEVDTPMGPVSYRYHSMTDLSSYGDSSFDLVYSGQSIEHVTVDDAKTVLAEVHRVLEPGGYVAIDTPNARVTRLQQEELIDPDHEIEYQLDELLVLLAGAGFESAGTMGLNLAASSLATGHFDMTAVARKPGLFAQAEDCYILCVIARKPELAH